MMTHEIHNPNVSADDLRDADVKHHHADHFRTNEEIRAFSDAMKFGFDPARWLQLGLEATDAMLVLWDFPKPAYPSLAPTPKLTREILRTALDAAIAIDDEMCTEHPVDADLKAAGRTKAWLGQSNYALWKRVSVFEERVKDIALDNLEDLAQGKRVDVSKQAEKAWRDIVWSFITDTDTASVDRVLR